jgi:protease IV
VELLEYTRKMTTTSTDFDLKDKIAIIYAQGEIMSGEGDINTIGEGSMNRSLIEARNDKDVKAIVLRIDSPGGSALTSDLIWREIELTKKVKPVVVSMGNYAASGGYYIACNANKIFAENNTITGSIGVFGILPNFTQLATKIGIHTEQVKTNENAAEYSPFVPMDEKFKAVTLQSVEHIYKTFVSHVAAGRKMTLAQVDSIAQGRVWSGEQALKVGLVDKIGGLDDALQEAAKLAKIKDYKTQNFPEFKKDINDLLENFPFAKSKQSFIKEELGEETFRIMEQIKRMQSQKGVQAIMPFEITMH